MLAGNARERRDHLVRELCAVSRTLGGGVRPYTAEQEEDWYSGATKSESNRVFTIYGSRDEAVAAIDKELPTSA